ncbi:MAG: hypothetical protein K2O59_06145, partial [Lachnospiraceae bacterium]|nr:hypothetical protein [Lachnospiraceae bacterium]
ALFCANRLWRLMREPNIEDLRSKFEMALFCANRLWRLMREPNIEDLRSKFEWLLALCSIIFAPHVYIELQGITNLKLFHKKGVDAGYIIYYNNIRYQKRFQKAAREVYFYGKKRDDHEK